MKIAEFLQSLSGEPASLVVDDDAMYQTSPTGIAVDLEGNEK
jgi:hypothetical protein